MGPAIEWLERHGLPDEDDHGRMADFRRLAVRTVVDTFDDHVPGMAAEMAFYIVLSLPPLLLVVFGAVGFVVGGLPEADVAALQENVLDTLATFLARDTVDEVLRGPVEMLLREGRGDVLSLGIVLTIWSASRSANVVLRTVVVAYELEDPRPTWQRRLLALGLTVAGAALAVVVVPLMVVGPDIARELLSLAGLAAPLVLLLWVYASGIAVLLGAELNAEIERLSPSPEGPYETA